MSWARELARSSVSSRSWVLRRTSSLRAAAAVISTTRAVSSRFSRSRTPKRSRASPSRGMSAWALGMARLPSGPPLGHAAPVFQVLAAAIHQRHEGVMVLGQDSGADAFHSLRQGLQRFSAEIIETLDLIIKLRALLRHARGHIELRIKGRTG